MSEHSERPILSGFMVLDGWAEDYSDWDGQITGPDNPRGANMAWLDPIPMIETRAYDQLREALEWIAEPARWPESYTWEHIAKAMAKHARDALNESVPAETASSETK